MSADRRERGYTLVELLVGILVALLIGLAATSTAIVFARSQRAGVGTALAVTGATSALTAAAEGIAQAGLGFVPGSGFICQSLNLSHQSRSWTLNPFSPIQITAGADSDTLDVFYGSEITGGIDVSLAAASDLASAELASALPLSEGQAILVSPLPSPSPADAASAICSVRTVTARSGKQLAMAASGQHNQVTFPSPSTYPAGARVSLLGKVEWHRFSVVDGNLVISWPLEDRSEVILRNVVAFRAQYGIGTGAGTRPTSLDSQWVDATNTWSAIEPDELPLVRAVRLSVLSRTGEPQRPGPGATCDRSDTRPSLAGRTPTLPVDWACHAYRTAAVTIPLRNLAWGMNP